MKEKILKLKKNIISWYPINKNNTVLQIGIDDEISKELKEKSDNVTIINYCDNTFDFKFDYVTLIGNFDKMNSEKEIIDILEYAKSHLNSNGKILLAMSNKFGMKYLSGGKVNENMDSFQSIVSSKENVLSFSKIKIILDNLKLKYKFYYPLPDYKTTNVIYTDEFLPTRDGIDSRLLILNDNNDFLNFSEKEAYKQLITEDVGMFPFFSNSFFIEISNKEEFENIKFVSYSISRKNKYRIKTIIRPDVVYKYADNLESKEHIKEILNNIKILNECKIENLDKCQDDVIESKFLKDAVSFDSLLMKLYHEKNLNLLIDKIKEFKEKILDKLQIYNEVTDKTVFDKYEVELSNELKDKLHFVKYGILDLTFQNCLVKDDKMYIYDQEWVEENVPIEFILYRAILYLVDLRETEEVKHIYITFGLEAYIKYFEALEFKIQNRIIDEDIWGLYAKSVSKINTMEDNFSKFKNEIKEKENYIVDLQNQMAELEEQIIKSQSQVIDFQNQLKIIEKSLSWKITKPLRAISKVVLKNKK